MDLKIAGEKRRRISFKPKIDYKARSSIRFITPAKQPEPEINHSWNWSESEFIAAKQNPEETADSALINYLLAGSGQDSSSSSHKKVPEACEVLSSDEEERNSSELLVRNCDRNPQSACHGVAGCFVWRDEVSKKVFCETCWEEFARDGLVAEEPTEIEVVESPTTPPEARGWEQRESRSQPGTFYWWNKVTGVSQFNRP
eukprot:gnl/MRDRNA2_/MRDRNA2_31195_c0_seq1.p1 gnl/MRDRNA2_/MRDRNA2_31195_c0~~gnl/MRDRNA2_/MRDRNA2_31195_c0_seq1.p1  ORF type:complete len:200 (-),score=30.67 gnl/MRDRNA2_/MRDRNA2_31195_c0_seq1:83-682(-)